MTVTVPALLQDAPAQSPLLRSGTLTVPDPQPGQVRLAVHRCGLNPVDAKVAVPGVPGWTWPHVPGLDVVGTVEAVGSPADEELLGRVVAVHHDLRAQGGLAGAVCVEAAAVAGLPDGQDLTVAATAPCPGLTAVQAVERTGVSAGDSVLVIGAGGAVGCFAVQLAARRDAEVVAVCGTGDSRRVLDLGARATIDHRAGEPAALAAPFGPFDVVIDLVGAASTEACASLMSYCGRLASVARPDLASVPPFTLSPTSVEIALGAMYSSGTAADRVRAARALGDLISGLHAGELVPPPVTELPMAEATGALAGILDGSLRGKVVVRLD